MPISSPGTLDDFTLQVWVCRYSGQVYKSYSLDNLRLDPKSAVFQRSELGLCILSEPHFFFYIYKMGVMTVPTLANSQKVVTIVSITKARSFFCLAFPQWPIKRIITIFTAGILHSVGQRPAGRLQTVTKGIEPLICTDLIHHKFARSRIPDKVFQPSPADHEKYGGDPKHLHKLHIVTRIRTRKRHPFGKKVTIKMLGLEKAPIPQVHKNIPSVKAKKKVVKHLIRIKSLLR